MCSRNLPAHHGSNARGHLRNHKCDWWHPYSGSYRTGTQFNFVQSCRESYSYNLKLNFNKYHIRHSSVPYVGHSIIADGLKSDPVKMEAIQNMPPLLAKEGLKRFLSFITYKFIANFSQVDAPLCQLLQRDVEFVRQPVQQSTFDRLKELCTLPPVLKYFNPAKPVVIFCDASSNRLGAVLL